MSNNTSNEDQSASPFNSPMLSVKERSNSIQLSLGNASIFLPVTFSQDNINDLMKLASKFEFEDEENDDPFDEQNQKLELTSQQISLNLCSSNCSQKENVSIYN